MAKTKGELRICEKGHKYYKSSSCPVCPVCEKEREPESAFLKTLVAPARRALENAGIITLRELSRHTESELLALHGMGPSSIPKLKKALEDKGLSLKV